MKESLVLSMDIGEEVFSSFGELQIGGEVDDLS